VSPPDRVDLHVRHSARHPTPESFVSELSEHYVNRLCNNSFSNYGLFVLDNDTSSSEFATGFFNL